MGREKDDPHDNEPFDNEDYYIPRRRSRYEDVYQNDTYDDSNDFDDYEDAQDHYPRQRSSRQPQRSPHRPPAQPVRPPSTLHRVSPRDGRRRPARDYDYEDEPIRHPRRKRTWPALLGGCLLGILLTLLAIGAFFLYTIHSLSGGNTLPHLPGVPTTHTFSQKITRSLSSQQISQISQIIICNPSGNVSLTVDPTQTSASLQTTRIVQETNQSNANKKFQQFAVEVQPPDTIKHALSCSNIIPSDPGTTATNAHTLTISVSLPGNDTTNNSADLAITLPSKDLINTNGPSTQLAISAAKGNISIAGLSGSFNLQSNTGNITVKQAILTDGSRLSTSQGDILFSGFLSNASTNKNTSARYIMQSEHAIDVTLPSNTSVILDANTNAGAIKSDFPLDVKKNGGSASYNGPLNPGNATNPSATLILDVSIGDVTIHKLQAP
jgi:hypothetical protein